MDGMTTVVDVAEGKAWTQRLTRAWMRHTVAWRRLPYVPRQMVSGETEMDVNYALEPARSRPASS